MPIAAIIFDLDGTLVDSAADIALAANAVRRHFGLAEIPAPVIRSYVGDGVGKLLERTLGHDAATGGTGGAVDPARLDTGLAVIKAHYAAHLLDATVPYPGTREVLQALAPTPLVVATNKPRVFSERILAGLDLDRFFVRVVGGDDPPARKPDPVHLACALDGLTLGAGPVVMVGDSPNDVLAGRAFGAVTVGCTYGLVPRDEVLAAGPDHVLDAMTDLPPIIARIAGG